MAETLKDRLVREIVLTGPMTVADYVTRCLHDPRGGYYATRPALGERGDFITAPMVSQMFGELIGLWAVETWTRLGAPERVRLVEVGPGDGTLMSDVLRAARLVPGFLQAVDLILIEPSAPLRAEQARRLADADVHPRWLSALHKVETDAPVILIANEVLDCLPARQFIKTEGGWAERRIGVTDDNELTFGLTAIADGFETPGFEVEPGQIIEISRPSHDDPRRVGSGAADRLWPQQARGGRHPAGPAAAPEGRSPVDAGRGRPDAMGRLPAGAGGRRARRR